MFNNPGVNAQGTQEQQQQQSKHTMKWIRAKPDYDQIILLNTKLNPPKHQINAYLEVQLYILVGSTWQPYILNESS